MCRRRWAFSVWMTLATSLFFCGCTGGSSVEDQLLESILKRVEQQTQDSRGLYQNDGIHDNDVLTEYDSLEQELSELESSDSAESEEDSGTIIHLDESVR